MVGYGARGQGVGGEDVVVDHVVLVAIVVEGDGGFAVVGGVDVEAAVEDVGGGVGGIEMGYEGFGVGHFDGLMFTVAWIILFWINWGFGV